jgi:hypothetical protein
MKTNFFAAFVAISLAACATTSGPVSSWGKEGVSMLDYQTDGILCATLAENGQSDNAANSAGGIQGRNSGGTGLPNTPGGGPSSTAPSAGAATPIGGGGVYRESASSDFVNRAAMQQRTQEMAKLKAKNEALHSCLVKRGYTEFRLTADERAKLASLPEGSEARRKFLYDLGTNPEVLKNASSR